MIEFTVELEESIIKTLRDNLKNLRYGSVGVVLKIHNGAISDLTYTINKSNRTYLNETVNILPNNERSNDVK